MSGTKRFDQPATKSSGRRMVALDGGDRPKWCARSLSRLNPGAINTILISHFHPDHIFGLMEKDTNKPVFPRSKRLSSRRRRQ